LIGVQFGFQKINIVLATLRLSSVTVLKSKKTYRASVSGSSSTTLGSSVPFGHSLSRNNWLTHLVKLIVELEDEPTDLLEADFLPKRFLVFCYFDSLDHIIFSTGFLERASFNRILSRF